VRDENVPELKLFGSDGVENRFRVEPGIEQRRVALDFVPDEVTIHRQPFVRRGEHADFRAIGSNPFARATSRWRWLRVFADSSQSMARVWRKSIFAAGFAGFFKRGQFSFGNAGGACRGGS